MELFRLLGKIVINNEEAIEELSRTSKTAEKTSTKMSDSFKKIGTKSKELGNKFKGVSIAAGGLVTSLVASTEMTRDYRTEQGKLEAAFTTSGHSMSAATQTFEGLQAVLGETDQSVEAANHLAKLCQTEQELQTWTDICTGVFAEFGDSLPIEGLTEAANETAKVGTVTGSLADALNWAGVSEDEFNKQLANCSNEQERQALITDTLNGLYKDSANAYKETNKEVMDANAAQKNLTDSLSAVAEKIEPIITKFKNLAATVLEKVAGMNDGVFTFILALLGIVAALAPVLSVFGLVASGVGSLVKVFGTLSKGIALLGNPIGLIIIAITALVSAFMYLWKNCEGFRNFWINLWNKIKAKVSEAKENIVSTFNKLKTNLSNVFNAIKTKATDVWNGIKDAITNPIKTARNTIEKIIDKIKGFFPLKIGKVFSNLKLPKIDIDGGKAPFGIGGKGKLPSFDVKWNAKGAIFKKPTIFNTTQGLQGVGEAGAEAVAPIDTLQQYVASAVASQNEGVIYALQNILNAIQSLDGNMGDNMRYALNGTAFELNRREFGRLVKEVR